MIHDALGTHRVGYRSRDVAPGYYLSTSRSFGDLPLKEPQPLVIVDPDVTVHTLTPNDWAVVLCCDGVFNVLSDQDVADACWDAMVRDAGGPVEAAQLVSNRAQDCGSADNITVLVMRLGWSNPQTLL